MPVAASSTPRPRCGPAPTSADQNAGTLPFSLSWVFHRIAATAPMPSAPQITGTLSPMRTASAFAGLSAVFDVRAQALDEGRELGRRSRRRRRRDRGAAPSPRARPSAREAQVTERGARLGAGRHRHHRRRPPPLPPPASVPPDVTAEDAAAARARFAEAPRASRRCCPEYEETTTSVCGPGVRAVARGRGSRRPGPSADRGTRARSDVAGHRGPAHAAEGDRC